MLPFQATQAHQLATTVKESVKELQSTCSKLHAQLEQEADAGLDLRQKIDALYNFSMQYSSPWSSTRPEPQLASPEALQQVDIQAETDAAEASIAASIGRLQQMQLTLRAGREAAHTWQLVMRLQSNRWRNDHGTPRPLLLCLPQEVLRTIAHKASKKCRLVCTALRLAHGAPGSGLTLARSQDPRLFGAAARQGAIFIDSRVGSWLQPGDVTQLHALSFLPPSTCAALASALPNLRAVTILGGMHSPTWLGPHVTSLLVARAPWQDSLLPGSRCQQLSALQSLTVTGCEDPFLSNLAPLALLLQLTSLTLTRVESRAAEFDGSWTVEPRAMDYEPVEVASGGDGRGPTSWGRGTGDDSLRGGWVESPRAEDEYARVNPARSPGPDPVCDHGVWGVLAAVPKLARLRLDVAFNYHSRMPAGAMPLAALTHLAVQTDPTMAKRDVRREVEVPFMEVLELLPALLSLHLLDGPRLSTRASSVAGRAIILEALRIRGLQHLQVAASFLGGSPEAFAALLSPSLVSLKSEPALPLLVDAVHARFPGPLPLKSLDIVYSCDRSTAEARVALALPLLCECLPALTHLTLRPACDRTSGTRQSSRPIASEQSHLPGPPIPVLAALSNLQELCISGSVMVAAMTASLPLLPALTQLQLRDMMAPEQATVLASLSRLRSLHLPWGKRYSHSDGASGSDNDAGTGSDNSWTSATVGAMKQMRGLTELVLGDPQGHMRRTEEFHTLLPLPVTLRRLVVAREDSVAEAMWVCGGVVDVISSMGRGY